MTALEGLTLDNWNPNYQFFGPFLVQTVTAKKKLNWHFGPLKGSITAFTIIFGHFWVPIVITNKIFMPILDLSKDVDLRITMLPNIHGGFWVLTPILEL